MGKSLPEGIGVYIEVDDDYDETDHLLGDEYTQEVRSGKYMPYGVSLVRLVGDGAVAALIYKDGSTGPDRLASLWGCVVENSGAAGLYESLADVPDDYLRSVAADLTSELK